MSLFERYLTLWVGLCIVVGIALGHFFPAFFHAVGAAEVAHVNLGLILGEESRQVAAEVRSSATTRLGQITEERAQTGEANRIDDVSALPGGLDEAGLFEGGQMERQRRRHLPKLAGEFAGRHAGGALGRQEPHQVEAGFLRKGTESGGSVR